MDQQQPQTDPGVPRPDQSGIDKRSDHDESTSPSWDDLLSSQKSRNDELSRDVQHQYPLADADRFPDSSGVGRAHPVQSESTGRPREDGQPEGHFAGSDLALPTSETLEALGESTLAAAAPQIHKDADQGQHKSRIVSLRPLLVSAGEPTTSAGEGSHEQDATQHQPDSPSLPNLRPESTLCAPLMHPNGVSIFPDLSMPEQEEMSNEALMQAEEAIVADYFDGDGGWDNDSDGGYDSDTFSSGSTSATSSIRDYMYENGRRYHRFREGTYNFPNDDVEQEREDMKHAMVKLLCRQNLYFAPISNNPQEVLDLGTGTGMWAIEMGDQYPSAHVLGIDLSPIQPDWLPPNVRFMVDDMESPWLHPRNHFDFIHSRHTVMAVKDWSRLFRRSLEHLKPGGWIELQEIHHRPRSATPEGVVPKEHPVAKFWTLVTEGLAALNVDLDISSGGHLANKMQEAGFTNVTERVFRVPIGVWPKNKVLKAVGLYWRTILLDGLQAIALGPLTRGLRWNREQVELFLMDVRPAYHDNAALMYMPLHIIYAQKPETIY